MREMTSRGMAIALVAVGLCTAWPTEAASVRTKLPAETAKLRGSSRPGYSLALHKCGICHSADYIAYQPPAMTLPQWTAEVMKMKVVYGAPIGEADIALIGAYLATAYGSARQGDRDVVQAETAPAAKEPTTSGAQALLESNGCLGCHAVDRKVVGPAYKDVAARYRDDPQAQSKLEASVRAGSSGKWGTAAMPPFASLPAGDLRTLVEFIRKQ